MLDLEKPVIWTSRGNVNEDNPAIEKFSEWEFPNPRTIVHVLGVKDRATGEIIKRGVYVWTLPLDAGADVGKLS